MKTTDKNKNIEDFKPDYQNNSFLSDFYRSMKQYEKEQFIVPWQMRKTNEEKFLVK